MCQKLIDEDQEVIRDDIHHRVQHPDLLWRWRSRAIGQLRRALVDTNCDQGDLEAMAIYLLVSCQVVVLAVPLNRALDARHPGVTGPLTIFERHALFSPTNRQYSRIENALLL